MPISGWRRRPEALILVVEDEFLIAMELLSLFQASGWRVLGPAASVSEAMHLLDAQVPNAALLDYNLKGEPVTPVAERLRRMGVPFAIASAYRSSEIQKVGVLADAPLLPKPSPATATLEVIRSLLD